LSLFSEFRSGEHVKTLAGMIRAAYPGGDRAIMEVCGTHTMAIARYGLRSLLPEGLRLVSGPGCPVCVTPASVVDAAVELCGMPKTAVCTFGDMMRVPGSGKTLEVCRADGADVRMLYSAGDAVDLARKEPGKRFVFISVGFETTTPGIALSLLEADRLGLTNLSFLTANRLVIPAMEALCASGDVRIDGFLCPGHVSVIIGSMAYSGIPRDFRIPCVVGGFEPVDVLAALYALVRQIARGEARVENAYARAVTGGGNRTAVEVMGKVFKAVDAEWRGIGTIPKSGLALRDEYRLFDALETFGIGLRPVPEPKGCRCGDVLRGLIIPPECALFGKRCTPEAPVGPCMVSSEGSCAAFYKYGGGLDGR